MNYSNGQCCGGDAGLPATTSYCGCGCQYPVVPGANPALQTWNGQNFVVADGSTQNPITLNALRIIPTEDAQYIVASDSLGRLAYSSVEGTPIGAAYLNNSQTFSGTNTFTQPIVGSVENIANGALYDIPYQTGDGVTTFLNAGNDGQVLVTHNVSSPPSWENASTLAAGDLAGGSAGALPYQNSANDTQFLAAGTANYILQSNGASAPSWTGFFNGTCYQANLATTATSAGKATNVSNGLAGSLPYQTAPNTTGFTSVGASGQILTSGGTAAPSWTTSTDANTASAIVKRDASGNFSAGAITATNTAKAWYRGTISGTTLTQAAAYGVTVARTSAGVYTGTLSTALTTGYSVIVSIPDTAAKTIYYTVNVTNTTTFVIRTYALTVSGAALVQTASEVSGFSFVIFGS